MTIGQREEVVRVDGAEIYCRFDGLHNAEAPWLVFSNSLLTDLRIWDSTVSILSGGYRILRYDMRGHGKSSVTTLQLLTLSDLTNDLKLLLDHFKIRRVRALIGVSLGGALTLSYVLSHADQVDRAVICSTQASSPKSSTAAWDERISIARQYGMQELAKQTCKRWFSSKSYENKGLVEYIQQMIAKTSFEGFQTCAHALQSYQLNGTPSVPVLLVAGRYDGAIPQRLEEMHNTYGKISQLVMIDCGHLPSVEASDEFAATLKAFIE